LNVFIDNESYRPYNFIMDENTWKKRWSNDQIRSMLVEQYNAFLKQDTGIKRTLLKDVRKAAATPYAVIISGLRRATCEIFCAG